MKEGSAGVECAMRTIQTTIGSFRPAYDPQPSVRMVHMLIEMRHSDIFGLSKYVDDSTSVNVLIQ
jgi:hypothetical protein